MLFDNSQSAMCGPVKGRCRGRDGFVLIELIIVISLIAIVVGMALVNTLGLVGKYSFKAQADEIVSVMQKAVIAAAQSERRYEVIFDIAQQSYTLREISTSDLSEVLDEEVLKRRQLGENCVLYYVQFDDLEKTDEDNEVARFRAGRGGWQYGGKIVLLDSGGNEYSIVANRGNRLVGLEKGDVGILVPRYKDELPF